MTKITDIRDKKRLKPLTPEEAAERAYREHFKKTRKEDEPDGLASGKTDKDGFMSIDEKDEDDDK